MKFIVIPRISRFLWEENLDEKEMPEKYGKKRNFVKYGKFPFKVLGVFLLRELLRFLNQIQRFNSFHSIYNPIFACCRLTDFLAFLSQLAYRQVPKSTRSRRSISAGKCDMKNPCEVDIAGGDKTSTRVEGLLPYTRYEFTLSGYNSGGVGPSSIAAVQTQQGKPGVPDAVEPIPFAKFIRLRWKEPKMPNGEITKYHIFIDKHSNPRNATVDRHTREYLFGGLVPNTGYSLSIQAETTAGVGDKARVPVTTSTPRGTYCDVRLSRSFIAGPLGRTVQI